MRLTSVLVLCLAMLAPLRARAGNDDAILIGSDAMLSGGAVTATVSDGSAAWYNPAGLAQVQRQTLNINASTYGVSRTVASGIFQLSDGTRSSASVVDWQLVPCALSYARELGPKLVGAFGIFVPTTTDGDLRASLTSPGGTRWIVGLDQVRNEYAYIASLGARVSDNFRWGVALHGVYIAAEQMVQVGAGNPSQSNQPFLAYSVHRTTGDYGARVGLGFQWTPTATLALGLSLQSPTLTGVRAVRDDRFTTQLSTDAGGSFQPGHQDALDSVWELSTPLLLRLGASYALDRFRVMVDGSLSSSLDSSENGFDRKLSGNARLGGLFVASPSLTFGAGLFSDINGYRDDNPNFLGASSGVRFTKDLQLSNGKPLSFVTTLGLRYAFGWGHTSGVTLIVSPEEYSLADATRSRVRVNEFALNLAGGVTY